MQKHEKGTDDLYVYSGVSAIEIRDDQGNVLVYPTIKMSSEETIPSLGDKLQFVDTTGNVIGTTDGILPYDW